MGLNMKDILHLPNSDGCFVCGHENHYGLKVQFYVKDNTVRVDLNFADHFKSYPNITHGGIQASILDEAMGWSAFIFSEVETFLFTRELTLTYKRNAPLGEPLLLVTEYVGQEHGMLYTTKGKIVDMNGKVITLAKGKFFPIGKDKMAETITHLQFKDGYIYHPKAIEYCKIK